MRLHISKLKQPTVISLVTYLLLLQIGKQRQDDETELKACVPDEGRSDHHRWMRLDWYLPEAVCALKHTRNQLSRSVCVHTLIKHRLQKKHYSYAAAADDDADDDDARIQRYRPYIRRRIY